MSTELIANLQTLAEEANAAHRETEQYTIGALQRARQAGEALREAKALCPHGTWSEWLRENFAGSERTAQVYMRVARRWGELEAKAQNASLLPLREAVALLEAPRSARSKPAPKTPVEAMSALKANLAELAALTPLDDDPELRQAQEQCVAVGARLIIAAEAADWDTDDPAGAAVFAAIAAQAATTINTAAEFKTICLDRMLETASTVAASG